MTVEHSSESLVDPRTGESVRVTELHDEIETLTRAHPMPAEVEKVFLENRLTRDVEDGLLKAKTSFGEIAAGVVFKENIRGFTQHTAIAWYAVAPAQLGSTLNVHVFLTSSNQAVFGPEALVHYYGGGDATFYVYDWVTRKPAATIPLSSWGEHLLSIRIAGKDFPAVYIVNRTFVDVNTGGWYNQVLLGNERTKALDSIWKSPRFNGFPSPDPRLNRAWGPIIEPKSLAKFGTTNLLGYSHARLISDRVNAVFLPANSDMVGDARYEFGVVHLVDNHEMLAR